MVCRRPRRVSCLVAGALAALSWVPGAFSATKTWVANTDFEVEIDGAPAAEARLYRAGGRPSLLLLEPSLGSALLLELKQRAVRQVDSSGIEKDADGRHVDLDDAAVTQIVRPYTMEGGAVVFFWKGHRVQITRKPALVGETTMEALFEHSPIFREGMAGYTPSEEDVRFLRSFDRPITVDLFFGSWCPHCKATVPKFFKTLEMVANPNITLNLTGVPFPPFSRYPPAKEKGVTGVPTFIVYADEKEIGRFSTIPRDSSVEHELAKILEQFRQAHG
ncbi:MAG: TlpA family protein disulfide reductase [Acidobacteriota bacterium]